MSEQPALLTLNAKYISWAHTICASSAFIAALIVGVYLHYYKIVQNGYYGYPDEWFPSVSATIGDRYPERSIFQILIALTSGPRFLLLIVSYLRYVNVNGPKFALFGFIVGVVRTVTCGGWVYITSTDDHDFHDIFMISYIVLTIPWEYFVITSTPKRTSLRTYRFWTSVSFFAMLVPLVYFFIQHKVHRVAGAYSIYAYFEWSLIILDVAFDAWTAIDFDDLSVVLTASKLDFKIVESKEEHIELGKLKPKSKDEVSYLEIIVNVVNSFILWSNFTALPLVVWYFPLWNMGISGFELSILAFLFSFVLLIPQLRELFRAYPQIPRLVSAVSGIGSYFIETPDYRLLAVGVGVAFATMSLSNEIHYIGCDSTKSRLYATTFTLGLILSSIAKFSNYTNNPIWPIMHKENGGWNNTGLAVGIISALLTPKPSGTFTVKSTTVKPSQLITAVGFGTLLFTCHALITDSSTLIIWGWEGYPIEGPVPVPHGAVTIIACLLGTYLGLTRNDLVSNKVIMLGNLSAVVLYSFGGWIGYLGSLGYCVFLTMLVPTYFNQASKFNPGVIFTISAFVYSLLLLAYVWIVAYAFVPAGWLLRERTDIVLGSSTGLIALGLLNFKKQEIPQINVSNAVNKIKKIMYVFAALSVLIAYLRFPFQDPQPYHPDSKLFTAGIWTIHFGLDNDMWASEGRMRDLIRDLELDVVGLLESDTQRVIMGNRDLTQQLAEELNMYADFGPGPNKHTWGCALLSKFPILNSTHHLLPSPVGELAPAIHATLDVYGEMVDVVVFHSGQEEDVEDRLLQSLGVRNIMGSSDRPMVLLSYLVTTPLEGNYNNYVSEGSGMHDVDASDWDRWCEYILYKKLQRTAYARISRGTITDTEVQAAKFVVGSEDREKYSDKIIDESEVPHDMRFPSMFYGEGVRGHAYHVFDEPRYFE